MRRLNCLRTIAVSFGLAWLGTPPAEAGLIEFTFTGGGVGTLDGATLRNPSFRITLTGDTADVVLPYGTPDSFALFNLTATIDLGAPGVATFAESFYLESDYFEGLTTLTIGAMSQYPDDFYWLQGFPTAGNPYRLDASIGPITSPFNAGNFDFSYVATSLGVLNITQAGSATFQATASAVPEPSTITLLGLGLLGLVAGRRRALVPRAPTPGPDFLRILMAR
jgi:hypothetical protein